MSSLQFSNDGNGTWVCFRSQWYVSPITSEQGSTSFDLKDRYGWVRGTGLRSVEVAMTVAEDLEESGYSDEYLDLQFRFKTDRIRLPEGFPAVEQEFAYATVSNGTCYYNNLQLKNCKVIDLKEKKFSFMGKNYQLTFRPETPEGFAFVQIAEVE